jgi:hypothetical protein
LEQAITDAVHRTAAQRADVVVVANEEVTWRDSSAGCPQKGMHYTQVLTDGTRIILRVGTRRLPADGAVRDPGPDYRSPMAT